LLGSPAASAWTKRRRAIVEKVIADMREHLHDEHIMETRKRMLISSAYSNV
jgi:hypothetical protein